MQTKTNLKVNQLKLSFHAFKEIRSQQKIYYYYFSIELIIILYLKKNLKNISTNIPLLN